MATLLVVALLPVWALAQGGASPQSAQRSLPAEVPVSGGEDAAVLELASNEVYCAECGAKNQSDAAFCSSCGAELNPKSSRPQVVIHREEKRGLTGWEVVGIVAAVGCGACVLLWLIGLAAS
ncbi:MAG: zinc-ribbon domain-containing protein [bacterium]